MIIYLKGGDILFLWKDSEIEEVKVDNRILIEGKDFGKKVTVTFITGAERTFSEVEVGIIDDPVELPISDVHKIYSSPYVFNELVIFPKKTIIVPIPNSKNKKKIRGKKKDG